MHSCFHDYSTLWVSSCSLFCLLFLSRFAKHFFTVWQNTRIRVHAHIYRETQRAIEVWQHFFCFYQYYGGGTMDFKLENMQKLLLQKYIVHCTLTHAWVSLFLAHKTQEMHASTKWYLDFSGILWFCMYFWQSLYSR